MALITAKRMNSAISTGLAGSRCRDAGCRIRSHALDGHVPALSDPCDKARNSRQNAGAVRAPPELRRHELSAGFAGESVGDELLQVVADLDPDLPIRDGHHDQETVVLAALADAAAAVLEHLDGVLAEIRVRRERLDGCDNDHVAAGLLQRANELSRRGFARWIEYVGEVVDRLRECRNLLCTQSCSNQQRGDDNETTKRTKVAERKKTLKRTGTNIALRDLRVLRG